MGRITVALAPPPRIVTNTNQKKLPDTFKGVPFRDAVENRLKEIRQHSRSANELFTRIESGSADVKISLVPKDVCVTTMKDLVITAGSTQLDDKSEAPFKAFIESIVFELGNASNRARFQELDVSFGGGTKLNGEQGYGRKRAFIEAESTYTVVTVMRELGSGDERYEPSAWGTKQVSEVGTKTLEEFKPYFAETPHNSTGEGMTSLTHDLFAQASVSLKTQDMYTQVMVNGMSREMVGKVQSIATVSKGGKTLNFAKLRTRLTPEVDRILGAAGKKEAPIWYWCCVELGKKPPDADKKDAGEWTVAWNGAPGDWELPTELRKEMNEAWKEAGGKDLQDLLTDARNEAPRGLE